MERALPQPDRGCLAVADISGYTEYLLGSELDHAQDVLADLLETVVRGVGPVLRVSKLEGDAILAYALAGSFSASTVLDAIEGGYFAFRKRVRDIGHATSCTCDACRLIPTLDLKFVIHDGGFVRLAVAGGEELAGPDVIVVHRLLKNSVAEVIGTNGYALLTDACVQALGLDPMALGMREHAERYEDVGEVRCWLQDLDERWRFEQERRRVYVLPTDADFEVAGEVAGEPALVWEYMTSPAKRALWQAERVDQDAPGGRAGVGTTNHCVHGGGVLLEEVLDWRPFRYYTVRYHFPGTDGMTWTYELEPGQTGTLVRVRGERLEGKAGAAWAEMRAAVVANAEANSAKLAAVLADVTAEPAPVASLDRGTAA